MKPFRPHAFPPRRLRASSFEKYLKTANKLLEEYHVPSMERARLVTRESIASTRSRSVKKYGAYQNTLNWAIKNAKRPISKRMICTIQAKIKDKTALAYDVGQYRNRQNWIGPEGCTIDEAYFYPPVAEQVEGLMRQLITYAKKKEKEPLLQLALFFGQLLLIHPFMDGNGRVARILIPIFLTQKKVLKTPYFFMSGYFLKHRLRYFQCLYNLREVNNWEEWIVFFLKGVISEAKKKTSRKTRSRSRA